MPADRGWYVVGSNVGRTHDPGWTGNVIATPEARVSFQGHTTEVVARQLSEESSAEVWPHLGAVWPRYGDYADRSSRVIRVFYPTPDPPR